MTAFLAENYSVDKTDPSDKDRFFDGANEMDEIIEFIKKRECPLPGFPPPCDVNLFFGFFFDGTNNNMKRDVPLHCHSNVARLYRAFPGGKDTHGSEAWPDLETKYHNSYFRTYVPGVGTRFDEVGDTGEGFSALTSDRARGLAFAYKGENRIIWALVEALNNVHRYYTDAPLVDDKTFKQDFNTLSLPSKVRPSQALVNAFTQALQKLHSNLRSFVPTDGPAKSVNKGRVLNIFVSMFGFSRGAAEARSFANWFIWLCKLDAQLTVSKGVKARQLSMGTIEVTFDFMGLFDTVASVGLAASVPLPNRMVDGHGGWADTEVSLRIPTSPGPTKCLHLVSAHEVRRSFPLDSVAHLGNIPPNCTEIVFPGVHSDIGGGYLPQEQGRGTDPSGGDLMSRITLATMYRAARLAGVPLKLEEASEATKRAFRIDPRTIATFNAYIGFCHAQQGAEPSLRLHRIMEFQHMLYIQWRKKMLGKMGDLPNVKNLAATYKSGKFDFTDLTMADKELEEEVASFEKWRTDQRTTGSRGRPRNPEWGPIAEFWDKPVPPAEVNNFFEQFVHDSRAWFKPLGKDIPDLWYALELLVAQEERAREWENGPEADPGKPNPYSLSKKEKEQLLRYKAVKGTENEMDAIEPDKGGRENRLLGGGYLRFRSIYMGSDTFKPSGAQYAGMLPVLHKEQRIIAMAHHISADAVESLKMV
ncbi:hypothetical protein JAB6_30120 [Janthinobacterium sp. HH104]|uniref:T6SS phospholipase effector Tle1-like catalytic domain-containing protein n=1 Tax=unclassified Janthinobacterium TaxID=2610881 RepID=UPI000892D80C|nr:MULTISPECIES: DUF2235 domain-containing protein [unclassified Janthinobacterium]MDX8121069.1 DUF2235 domain-containing protein [Janthinobacterium sp. GMG2]OEZ82970.1 hypothetical protein JAB6_30120 [Janthinobacterium sp. HH104]